MTLWRNGNSTRNRNSIEITRLLDLESRFFNFGEAYLRKLLAKDFDNVDYIFIEISDIIRL